MAEHKPPRRPRFGCLAGPGSLQLRWAVVGPETVEGLRRHRAAPLLLEPGRAVDGAGQARGGRAPRVERGKAPGRPRLWPRGGAGRLVGQQGREPAVPRETAPRRKRVARHRKRRRGLAPRRDLAGLQQAQEVQARAQVRLACAA
jgi:hypothetical protein